MSPLVTFLVLPIFALANAGVGVKTQDLTQIASDPLFLGIVGGLFIGKQIGILVLSRAAVALGLADLPASVGWRDLHGVAVTAGVGFTMSLFIASLAYQNPELHSIAKQGILLASVLSAIVGWLLIRLSPNAAYRS